jgi:hypothetical protein
MYHSTTQKPQHDQLKNVVGALMARFALSGRIIEFYKFQLYKRKKDSVDITILFTKNILQCLSICQLYRKICAAWNTLICCPTGYYAALNVSPC